MLLEMGRLLRTLVTGGQPADGLVPTAGEVRRYRRLRMAGRRLSNKIVKTIPERALDDVGGALGMLDRRTFVFDSEAEVNVFTDCCLYDWVEGGANLVERYAAEGPPPANADEREALDAMTRARYTILELDGSVPRKGVRAIDLRTGERLFVIDINLSLCREWSGECLAARLLPFGRFWMTSGAALPLAPGFPEAVMLASAMSDPDHLEAGDILRLLDDPVGVLALVRCALETGSGESMGFSEDLDSSGREVLATAPPVFPRAIEYSSPRRPARNAPCPCGSGRQYKRCCGSSRHSKRSA